MKNKDFKLLIERFNKFLMKEHMGHSQDDILLFDAIPQEFKDYVNDTLEWYNGVSWLAEVDSDSVEEEQDLELLFDEVAKACGCNVKDLLVTHEDMLDDGITYNNSNQLTVRDFLDAYDQYSSNTSLCGSFEINGVELKGFYFMYGTDISQFGIQFSSPMSDRNFKGLIFVAPTCSGSSKASSKPTRSFKSSLGGAWG